MTALQQSFRQVAAQFAPRVALFVRWWRESLLAWLPMRWRWALGWAPARLLLLQRGDALILQREIGSERTDVGRLPWPCEVTALDAVLREPRLRQLPRSWLLPSAGVLRRTLRLPARAAERLRDVLGYEIDRQTPFTADQVTWDARLLGAREGDQVEAELVVMSRRQLEDWRAAMGAWADAMSGIDVLDEDGRPLQVNLLPLEQRRRGGASSLRRDLLLIAAALVLLVLAGNRILDNRQQAADVLRADVEQRAGQARSVATERARLQALVDGAAFLEAQRARRAGTLQVWAELTRLLPDGTYLEKLGIENDQLQLIGLSREANQLVPLLQASTLWRRVYQTGVLQADGTASGRDRFTLTAELVPTPAATPATTTTEVRDAAQRP